MAPDLTNWDPTSSTGHPSDSGCCSDWLVTAATVPEPSIMLLFGTGLAGQIAWRYRKSVNAYTTTFIELHNEPDSSRGWALVFYVPPLNGHFLCSPDFVWWAYSHFSSGTFDPLARRLRLTGRRKVISSQKNIPAES